MLARFHPPSASLHRLALAVLFGLSVLLWTSPSFGQEAVELNRATVAELEALPGIGQKKAEAIIRFRDRHGFRRPADLLRIRGIGRRLYYRLKPLVRVVRPGEGQEATN